MKYMMQSVHSPSTTNVCDLLKCQHPDVLPMHDDIPDSTFDTALGNEVEFADEHMEASMSPVDLGCAGTYGTFEDEVELSCVSEEDRGLLDGPIQDGLDGVFC